MGERDDSDSAVIKNNNNSHKAIIYIFHRAAESRWIAGGPLKVIVVDHVERTVAGVLVVVPVRSHKGTLRNELSCYVNGM